MRPHALCPWPHVLSFVHLKAHLLGEFWWAVRNLGPMQWPGTTAQKQLIFSLILAVSINDCDLYWPSTCTPNAQIASYLSAWVPLSVVSAKVAVWALVTAHTASLRGLHSIHMLHAGQHTYRMFQHCPTERHGSVAGLYECSICD